ncbi:uncharacterized protein TRUGW13939_09420 [Talaromyces rugulosus]|uniref:non-specific serine/threonine protein kinase n=1 Tax=Talaromyces rugulosus TaxID=121627 RepID=A0A7H8R964_TALRU|nr:uncharacterized protein TRUGW13939_09420 [Talaromyces rugulosus]QKX62261.1 hypothetical protein TRUGW13939_09420 [Talaromyces rugulosus]
MPEALPIEELHYERQIQTSIGLVTIADTGQQYIFKGRPTPNALYHEIKMLLSIDRHPNIIERPVKLVTTQTDAMSEARVCGFLLPYYDKGAMQEALPRLRLQGELKLQDQLRWSKQLTAALKYIHSSPALFYSDLKMDNVLLAHDENGKLKAVLADLEQSRNFYNWAPPEVYYIEWIVELGDEEVARSGLVEHAAYEKHAFLFHVRESGKMEPIGIVRRGGRVFPLGRSGVNCEPTATLEETKQAIKSFWRGEMEKAERFAWAQIAYATNLAQESDIELLDYLRRPKLTEVLEVLNGFSLPTL